MYVGDFLLAFVFLDIVMKALAHSTLSQKPAENTQQTYGHAQGPSRESALDFAWLLKAVLLIRISGLNFSVLLNPKET